MKTELLIDGDIMLYQIGCANERDVRFSDGKHILYSEESECFEALDGYVFNLKKKLDATDVTIGLSDSKNFRKEVYKEYKSNRVGSRKPLVYQTMKDYCFKNYNTLQWPTLEGDDVLGILATEPVDHKRIVVSIDKDMETIPCNLYNPDKDDSYRVISEVQADYKLHIQALTGDRTDNYPGCPKMGPVTAEKTLEDSKNLWESVVGQYKKQGLDEAFALTQMRCARILRFSDYKDGVVKLWSPK